MLVKRSLPFEVKQVDEESGIFEGYASVFGNVDDQGDVIERGAFTKTLQEAGHRVKICWQHDPRTPIGKPIELREDENGLYVKAKIAPTTVGKDALVLLRDGIINELSIGYDVVKDSWKDGIRYLKEIRLWEISPVTWAANRLARITGVKKVTPFADLPLAPEDREWDASAAIARVRTWAGGPDKDDIDWSKYQKAFLWYDSDDPENFGSYKLPFADVINGTLYAVPRGIFSAAGVIQGAMGGVDVPDADIPKIKQHLEKYYKKMDRVAPWNQEGKMVDFNTVLQTEELRRTFWKLIYALEESLESILYDEDIAVEEKPGFVASTVDQFKQAMLSWVMQAIQANLLRSEDQVRAVLSAGEIVLEQKAGRVLSAANAEKVRAAISALEAASEALQALLEAAEGGSEPDKSTHEPGSAKGAADDKTGGDPDDQSNPDDADENIKSVQALLESLRAVRQSIRGGA